MSMGIGNYVRIEGALETLMKKQQVALLHILEGQLQVFMSSDLSPLVMVDAVPSPLLLYGPDLDFRTDLEFFHQVLRSRDTI